MPEFSCSIQDSFLTAPKDRGVQYVHARSRAIENFKKIFLISAIGSAIILPTILILQAIPIIPAACCIALLVVLTISILVSIVSFTCFLLNIRKSLTEFSKASLEIQEDFAKEFLKLIQLMGNKHIRYPTPYGTKAEEAIRKQKFSNPSTPIPSAVVFKCSSKEEDAKVFFVEKRRTPIDENVKEGEEKEPIDQPSTSSSDEEISKIEEEDLSQVASGNRGTAFCPNSIGLTALWNTKSSFLPVSRHPKYKKAKTQAVNSFSTICKGLNGLLTKFIKSEQVVAHSDLLMMFSPVAALCTNKNPLLSIIYNSSVAFGDPLNGAIWLHEALYSSSVAYPLFDLIEQVKKTIIHQSKGKRRLTEQSFSAALILANMMLSGWCVSSPELSDKIVGSVQGVCCDEETKGVIVEMLNSGNIIGALTTIHGYDEHLTRVFDLGKSSKKKNIILENIDPVRARMLTGNGKEEEDQQAILEELSTLSEMLSKNLPKSLVALGYDIATKKESTSALLESVQNFVEKHSPLTPSSVILILQSLHQSKKLQSIVKNYLPYSGKEATQAVLSTLILGATSLGLLTRNQITKLSSMLHMSEGQLMEKIQKQILIKDFLPNLF